MKRNLNKLANTAYDLIVVGAGIYGVATAWDAALRGLKVALIEKNDFGSATSANSLKTIHGGLRYLQQMDIKRMRESIHERMVLMNIAPNLVYPLPVIMPTYSYKMKSRPAMMAALMANDIVGFDRNGLKDPHKYMPPSYTISKSKVQEYLPGYTKYNLNGAAIWYDCQCYNTERLSLSFILSAAEKGADAANYVQSIGLLKNGNQVTGVKVKDTLTGNTFEIRGKMVVNNAGPWVDTVLSGEVADRKTRFQLSTAMNIVIKRPVMTTHAAGISGPYQHVHKDGSVYKAHRILFFSPWRKYTIIGTNHLPYNGKQEDYKVTEAEIQDFLGAVQQAYAAANIKREDITFFYGGFLPMAGTNPVSGEVKLQKHYAIYDHAAENKIEGLVSVVGVKYTTARDVGKKTVDLVFKKMNRLDPGCKTEVTRLVGGNIDKFADFVKENVQRKPYNLGESVMKHLCYNYGSALTDITDYGKEDEKLMQTVPNSDETLKAEVVHAVRHEMAQKLSDVILRRTDLGSGENPGIEALQAVAKIMAKELGWDEKRQKAEIDEVNRIYQPA